MATPPPPQPMRRVLLASIAGNVLEWYDFGVFAFLAPHIGYNFFPPADPVVQIINAFIVFAGGFIMRPLGGVLFGHIGDKYGRKKALILSVVLMGGSTLGIGCLPTYYNIGVLATALLALMRLLQGLSVGGEFVGSLVFAVESAPPARRCFAGSVCTAAATGGVSLGSWTGLLLNSALSEDQMREFGWRLPFFGGLLIGVFAYWARSNLHETTPSHQEGDLHHHQSKHSPRAQGCSAAANSSLPPSSPELAASCQEAPQAPKGPARSTEEMPLRRALQEHPRAIIVATAYTACYSFSVWFLTTFPPTLYGTLMQPPLAPPPQMWLLHALSSCFLSFFYPAWGWAGDAVGYVKMMLAGGVFIAIAAPPCTWMMGNGSVPMAAFGIVHVLVTCFTLVYSSL